MQIHANESGCAARICFEVDVVDQDNYYAIGVANFSLHATMGDMEMFIVGHNGTIPEVYHGAPSGRFNAPTLFIDPCIHSIEKNGSTVKFARNLDTSGCIPGSYQISNPFDGSMCTAIGAWNRTAARRIARQSEGLILQHFVIPVIYSYSHTGATNGELSCNGEGCTLPWWAILLIICAVLVMGGGGCFCCNIICHSESEKDFARSWV